jgi:hypothetical protein
LLIAISFTKIFLINHCVYEFQVLLLTPDLPACRQAPDCSITLVILPTLHNSLYFILLNHKNMKKFICIVVSIASALFTSAQARSQADVSISSMSITAVRPGRPTTVVSNPPSTPNQPGVKTTALPGGDVLKCTITVHSYWDDDAHSAMLVVVLPVEVSIVSNPSNATVNKINGSAFAGNLVFNLGQMAVNQTITVEFTFTKSQYGNKVGAYAYSATPDPNPANNYKDATY